MYENSDKSVLNRKSRFSHFEVCCSYTFIRKPERFSLKFAEITGGHSRGSPSVSCIEKKYNIMDDSYGDRDKN